MQKKLVVGSFVLVVFLAGCATGSNARKQRESLNTRLDSLEGQVAAMDQRMEQISLQQAKSSEAAAYPSAGVSTAVQVKSARKPLPVRQVQQALASAGYYKGPVDGKEGPQTRKAIQEFQQAKGLKADGIVGRETSEALLAYLSAAER